MALRDKHIAGYIFAVLFGAVIGAWLIIAYKPLPEGKVLANQSAIDSLNAFITLVDSIENLPTTPVVTKTDTVYIDSIVYVTTTPAITSNEIKDSLIVKDEISVWVDIMVEGHLKDFRIDWMYTPIIKEITTIVEKPVYQPVITTVTKEVIKYSTGHYLSLATAGNSKMFTFGVDYSIIKQSHLYELEYRRYGDQNIYGVKIGVNLKTLFKK